MADELLARLSFNKRVPPDFRHPYLRVPSNRCDAGLPPFHVGPADAMPSRDLFAAEGQKVANIYDDVSRSTHGGYFPKS
jgi:hypothetical protein